MASTMTSSEMPTKLGTASRFAVVSPDKLSVKYTTASQIDIEVGAVQANKPAPQVDRAVYYFELIVKNAGSEGMIGIGFSKEGVDLLKMPGWRANSIGYHGDDGKLFRARGRGEPFGPTFTTNDVVGAGINYASNEFFFTKNGKLVGTSSKEIDGPLFPTVGLNNQNAEVKVNFGHKPFAYDDIKLTSYPCPYYHHHPEVDVGSKCSTTCDEKWKKLLEEKEKLVEKSESLMRKSFEEKEKSDLLLWKSLEEKDKSESSLRKSIEEKAKEVVSLKAVVKILGGNI